jgi:hypothetical protein
MRWTRHLPTVGEAAQVRARAGGVPSASASARHRRPLLASALLQTRGTPKAAAVQAHPAPGQAASAAARHSAAAPGPPRLLAARSTPEPHPVRGGDPGARGRGTCLRCGPLLRHGRREPPAAVAAGAGGAPHAHRPGAQLAGRPSAAQQQPECPDAAAAVRTRRPGSCPTADSFRIAPGTTKGSARPRRVPEEHPHEELAARIVGRSTQSYHTRLPTPQAARLFSEFVVDGPRLMPRRLAPPFAHPTLRFALPCSCPRCCATSSTSRPPPAAPSLTLRWPLPRASCTCPPPLAAASSGQVGDGPGTDLLLAGWAEGTGGHTRRRPLLVGGVCVTVVHLAAG